MTGSPVPVCVPHKFDKINAGARAQARGLLLLVLLISSKQAKLTSLKVEYLVNGIIIIDCRYKHSY